MTENNQQSNMGLPPVKVAFVIDGQVVDVLHTDDRLAAIFLSEPVMVDVTDYLVQNPQLNIVGATYDDGNFVFPEE